MKRNCLLILCLTGLLSGCYSLSGRVKEVLEENCHCKKVESEYDDSTMTFTLDECNFKNEAEEITLITQALQEKAPAACDSKKQLVIKLAVPGDSVKKYHPYVFRKCLLQGVTQ